MLSTLMLAAVAALSADAPKADWHADYGVALEETKQENQPLLVVMDIPGDDAQSLDPELLKAEGGALPLAKYALCHIDASTEYGKKVAEGFKVTEFPHVAIIDKSGSVILHRVEGDVEKAEWLSVLLKHQEGQRVGQPRYTVAKPVVSQPAVVAQPTTTVAPTTYTPTVNPTISYPSAPVSQPYCPSCQLRNRY